MKNFKADASASTRLDNRRRYAAAVRALAVHTIWQHDAGIDGRPPSEFNDAVIETGHNVPWWWRAMITRVILRQLDYWNRTGQ